MSITSAAPDWRRVHAFGLPGGSIRGLLALAMFGAVWGHLALIPEVRLPEYLQNLMFIILGHYFAARNQPPAPVPGPNPLYLPRGVLRAYEPFLEHAQLRLATGDFGPAKALLLRAFEEPPHGARSPIRDHRRG